MEEFTILMCVLLSIFPVNMIQTIYNKIENYRILIYICILGKFK